MKVNLFAVNLVGQVLSCGVLKNATHIRWMINDGMVPLEGIKGCGKNKDGMCRMDVFIKGMKDRIEKVDYDFRMGTMLMPGSDFLINKAFPCLVVAVGLEAVKELVYSEPVPV